MSSRHQNRPHVMHIVRYGFIWLIMRKDFASTFVTSLLISNRFLPISSLLTRTSAAYDTGWINANISVLKFDSDSFRPCACWRLYIAFTFWVIPFPNDSAKYSLCCFMEFIYYKTTPVFQSSSSQKVFIKFSRSPKPYSELPSKNIKYFPLLL